MDIQLVWSMYGYDFVRFSLKAAGGCLRGEEKEDEGGEYKLIDGAWASLDQQLPDFSPR